MSSPDHYLAALDLGNSKICALVCEVDARGQPHLAGLGVVESKGFRKGSLVNLEAAVSAIRQAVEAAETAAGVSIENVLLGVAGSHMRGINSRGGITLGHRPREVTLEDVRRAIEAARAITLPADREVLHVLAQEFFLDQQNSLRDPVGMLGTKLEVNVHVVTADAVATQNLVASVNRAGLLVLDTVLEPLASAAACLTADEQELGVLLVDIGGGTSEWIVYEHNAPRLTGVVPIGGEHFTHDIAVGLRVPLWEAERLKRAYGCAGLRWLRQEALVDIAGTGARVASRRALCEIIEARASELVTLLRDDLRRSGYERQLGAGVVLTGGGAQLNSLPDMAAQILQLPVRLGKPTGLLGLVGTTAAGQTISSPTCATAVGLILHGNRIRELRQRQSAGLWGRLKSFWQGKGWAA